MRTLVFRMACASSALAAAVACAASESDERPPPTTADVDEPTVFPDAAVPTEAAVPDGALEGGVDQLTAPPTCSPDGWCVTPLPYSGDELVLNDIWPLPEHAFAVAGKLLGSVSLLEWNTTSQQWSAIDDGTQSYTGAAPGSVWAANEDEVYYSLTIPEAKGGAVYYGKRPVPPETAWSWTRHTFDCPTSDRPHVWGTSRDDVFVMSCKKIYRLSGAPDNAGAGDGGADASTSPWVPEYVDDDTANALTFHGATGTSSDDAWFVGSRGTTAARMCAVVVRKTAAGFERIVDGVPTAPSCTAKPGFIRVAGAFGRVAGDSIHAPAKDRFVGVSFGTALNNELVRIATRPDGGYSVDVTSALPSLNVGLRSVWGAGEHDLWLIVAPPNAKHTNDNAGVVRGSDVWDAGGTYQYSTIALNGVPNPKALQRIRGTSNTNLWAVGANRAFHKTTP